MKNELQKHKKSDSIKWIIVFVLIAILAISMAGVIVQATTGVEENDTNSSADKDADISTNNMVVINTDLSDLSIYLSENGEDTLTIKQSGVTNAPDMDIILESTNKFFENEIFKNEYFYAKSMSPYDNFRFVFEKDGEYRGHDVCLDSVSYVTNQNYIYTGENGTEYKDVYAMLRINYFYDESGDGNNDVRYDTIMLMKLVNSNNPENEEYIGSYSWNIYSELSKFTAQNGYDFVGMYFTEEVSFFNCLVYNSATGK